MSTKYFGVPTLRNSAMCTESFGNTRFDEITISVMFTAAFKDRPIELKTPQSNSVRLHNNIINIVMFNLTFSFTKRL